MLKFIILKIPTLTEKYKTIVQYHQNLKIKKILYLDKQKLIINS